MGCSISELKIVLYKHVKCLKSLHTWQSHHICVRPIDLRNSIEPKCILNSVGARFIHGASCCHVLVN